MEDLSASVEEKKVAPASATETQQKQALFARLEHLDSYDVGRALRLPHAMLEQADRRESPAEPRSMGT